MKRFFFVGILFAITLCSCWDIQVGNPVQGIAPGTWRGVFKLDEQIVPIIYEVKNTNNEQPIEVLFYTGNAVIKGENASIFGDTITVRFPKTKTYLKLVYQIDQMDGFLYFESEKQYPVPFAGYYGLLQRFPDLRKTPKTDLTGEWRLELSRQDSSSQAQLRLTVDKNMAKGQLLLGEDRQYPVEGTVQDDQLYLSGFDGFNVYLLHATIQGNKTLANGSLHFNDEQYFWEAQAQAGVMPMQ